MVQHTTLLTQAIKKVWKVIKTTKRPFPGKNKKLLFLTNHTLNTHTGLCWQYIGYSWHLKPCLVTSQGNICMSQPCLLPRALYPPTELPSTITTTKPNILKNTLCRNSEVIFRLWEEQKSWGLQDKPKSALRTATLGLRQPSCTSLRNLWGRPVVGTEMQAPGCLSPFYCCICWAKVKLHLPPPKG